MKGPLRLGLIGDPVDQSLSPRFQTAALAAARLDGSYEARRTAAGQAATRLDELAREGWLGLNVTVPLKEEVFALLSAGSPARLDESARRLRAVNTLRWDGAGWEGHNTDAAGFSAAALRGDAAPDLAAGRVVLLGAGGAARAVLWALIEAGARQVSVWNRSPERLARLLADFAPLAGDCRIDALPAELRHCPGDAMLLVQATSLGLAADDPLPPPPPARCSARALDLVTHDTPWQERCRRAGCRVSDGREMLIQQGAAAFRIWTGREAPLSAMRAALDA